MSDDLVTLTINGEEIKAKPGTMLIDVADDEGIHIPRFCYHKKLSVAANCRMCLVDVEKAPKPLPACATPVMDGMTVLTRSERAVSAQKDTMEFLLINHPLDCPICDQGGECELQDLSVAHGNSSSNFHEMKRVVADKDIGPLIATEMTRCIQCTRCVRFGEEIAGMREMGATGRGDTMAIGTYIDKSLASELSGNIIDVCPVGALTAKPSRYKARAWEVNQAHSIASHDSVGSNINLHTFKGKVIRSIPNENEAINECWISDRDRFSYQGLDTEDRLEEPMMKVDGNWQTISWDVALDYVADHLNHSDPEQTGVLASARATTEELYLLQKLMRAKGISNIDHRLRQTDFSDQDKSPQFPWLGSTLPELEDEDVIVLIGSDVRREQPMANHRIRKAVLKGAKVIVINPIKVDFNYSVEHNIVASPVNLVKVLGAIATASGDVPVQLAGLKQDANDQANDIAQLLKDAKNATVLVGNLAVQHPNYATLRALGSVIASNTGASLGYLAESANTVGAWLTGNVPHRVAGGEASGAKGLDAADMMMRALKTFVLLDVDPSFDCDDPQKAEAAMHHAKVIALTSFASDKMRAYADILLPISTFAETSGSFINAEGTQQTFRAVAKAADLVKPAWKVLRVLGNTMEVDGFDYMSSEDVLKEFNEKVT
ncbi:MAG TPA: NADH-quinone oxidoreductase subunit G, partial [Thiothrix sp.]|nr:NADH-quinone oxidoreductase subunit G [Thiothrix sp.]